MGAVTLAEIRRRRATDARDEDRLAEAFEHRAMQRLSGELAPIFTSNGVGIVDRSREAAERQRVKMIIGRDIADRAFERHRSEAEQQVASGEFTNIADTVLPPTPEWLAKGDFVSFTPKVLDGTIRTIRTARRIVTPIVLRMHRAGKLTDGHAAACLWYRHKHEVAGLDGHSASSQWNPNSTIRGRGVDAGYGYLPTSVMVAEARDAFRAARDALPQAHLRFFEAIVLDDLPLRRAARFARCRNDQAQARFRDVVVALLGHLEGCQCGHARSRGYSSCLTRGPF